MTRRPVALMAAAAMILALATLLPYLTSGTELARARNALTYQAAPPASFEWTPASLPPDFLRDEGAPDPYFVAAVRALKLDALPTEWERAIAIATHLLRSHAKLSGGAIQSDLRDTHRRIVERGEGYCADFVRVFQAMAVAAGIPVRAWAFSFDGFGGHGHVWPEIWNSQARAWQLLDIFDNLRFVDGGRTLSALQLRQALLEGSPTLKLEALVPGARPGFVHEAKAWDYFRRGLGEWYLWWGNNPFDYERVAAVRWLSPLSRSLAQLGAIAQGVFPSPRLLATADNARQIAALGSVRRHILAVFAVCALALLVLLVLLTQAVQRRWRAVRRIQHAN
jgi:hypothetical protein